MNRTTEPGTNPPTGAADRIDVSFMYAVHDAFQRDLDRLIAMAEAGDVSGPALRAGWDRFTTFLTVHHTAEDTHLWPVLRERVADTAVLDQMEAEHHALDRLLEAVETAIGGPAPVLADRAGELARGLTEHCENEEELALPLVQKLLTEKEWNAFGNEQRSKLGLSGAASFFPWLLDGAEDATRRKVLGIVPPPVRLLYRAVWRPRYERAPRWQTPASA
ncbi:hemerythrin domain-containing protein [Actinomadura opuntiae]|uniref:hemerythrin domain-containing protein n=1 Tax=Actinomadura sp. OS1-43 TaxID=604315 RepID=UPI00255AD931|nr:hemerythrin domain-containing protein [Actinomadura sp. OS1-43]MDL4817673.1 hemerythrin domain-containing protein [Actinomadura sp. OS1-43]